MSCHDRAPLFDALRKYVDDRVIPFHVPGHKQGRVGDEEFLSYIGHNVMGIDLTIMEDLDGICNPKGVIKEAEELAALAYKADYAYFLSNGTSSGIQAMIMSVCQPGDKILLPRNAHKSAISGVILSGAEPVYLQPEINEYLGIAMGITPEAVQNALNEHPDLKAIFVINTTYYGVASDLRQIVDIAHRHGVAVLVDEAHGAHLSFHESLPLSAMEAGADMSAASTHKLTGSMTQSSMLLIREGLVNPKRVKAVMNLTQTTSPSYILLASLDTARRKIVRDGRQLLEQTIELANWARREINQISGLYIFDTDILGLPGCYAFDPTKVPISARGLGISGYEFERILRQEHGIQVELSDLYNVLALFSIGDNQETAERLVAACRSIASRYKETSMRLVNSRVPDIPELAVLPRDAFHSETVPILLEQAEGEISAEVVMAYPPGIPVVCPGERITRDIIRYIRTMRQEKLSLQGTEDPNVTTIKVLRTLSVVSAAVGT